MKNLILITAILLSCKAQAQTNCNCGSNKPKFSVSGKELALASLKALNAPKTAVKPKPAPKKVYTKEESLSIILSGVFLASKAINKKIECRKKKDVKPPVVNTPNSGPIVRDAPIKHKHPIVINPPKTNR